MRRLTFKIGGIHPPENKLTAGDPIKVLPLPMTAYVPLRQHIGAPAMPIVKKGDHVERGQMIARSDSFVSAIIHSPITGTIAAIEDIMLPTGYRDKAVKIIATETEHDADEQQRETEYDGDSVADRRIAESMSAAVLRQAIADAGIVGLGGATFPTHIKLNVKPDQNVDTLIINGCECEPYLTCDDALMRDNPQRIVEGIEIMLKASGTPRAIIAIEENKPEAIAAICSAVNSHRQISVVVLKTKYPQGGEKQLIQAVTGRCVPSRALPSSVGVIVNNVATAYAVYQAVVKRQPLIERLLTITGDTTARGNYRVAVGTPLTALGVELCDGDKVIFGGPMMGRTAVSLDVPMTKAVSGVLVMSAERASREVATACIRCGACVEACPMGLEPYLLSTFGAKKMWEDALDAAAVDCIECGSCSYSCPARRPLLDYIHLAKQHAVALAVNKKAK